MKSYKDVVIERDTGTDTFRAVGIVLMIIGHIGFGGDCPKTRII